MRNAYSNRERQIRKLLHKVSTEVLYLIKHAHIASLRNDARLDRLMAIKAMIVPRLTWYDLHRAE